MVAHNIRERLDEIKRREVDRLRILAREKVKTMNGMEVFHYISRHGGMTFFRLTCCCSCCLPNSPCQWVFLSHHHNKRRVSIFNEKSSFHNIILATIHACCH